LTLICPWCQCAFKPAQDIDGYLQRNVRCTLCGRWHHVVMVADRPYSQDKLYSLADGQQLTGQTIRLALRAKGALS